MAKEEKKKTKPAEKKMVLNILTKHPEVYNNARHLFRNENGRTIVEDRVPRGDPERGTVGNPHSQGDLTEADLRDLAKYATEIIDEGIHRYDEKVASEDALHRAINEKDGGKYAGKISAPTYALILSNMGKKKAETKKEASEDNSDTQITIDSSIDTKEEQMANLGELAKVAQIIANQTPEERFILRTMIKEAADQNDPKRWQKTLDAIGIKAPKSKNASEEDEAEGEDDAIKAEAEKKHDEDEKDHEEKETKAEKKKEEEALAEDKKDEEDKEEDKKDKEDKEEDKDASSIISELDSIAGELEASGDFELFKMAYQLDQVADVLEGKKTATALESEPDEKYMKDAFNSKIRQKDSDEKYMESFATDKTQEVSKAYSKRPYGIVK